jgi:hypothetical protein
MAARRHTVSQIEWEEVAAHGAYLLVSTDDDAGQGRPI